VRLPFGVATGLGAGVMVLATGVPFSIRLHQFGIGWPGIAAFWLSVPLEAALVLWLVLGTGGYSSGGPGDSVGSEEGSGDGVRQGRDSSTRST